MSPGPEADPDLEVDGDPEPELRAHGVVDAPLLAVVWDRGLRELVAPCALALEAAAA